MALKFDPTITLGSVLTIFSLVLSAGSGVAYISAAQAKLLDHQTAIDSRQDKMEQEFVRTDVRKEQDALIQERFDQIIEELKSIRGVLSNRDPAQQPTGSYWRH